MRRGSGMALVWVVGRRGWGEIVVSRVEAGRIVRDPGLIEGLSGRPRPLLAGFRWTAERRGLPPLHLLGSVLALVGWVSSSTIAARVRTLSTLPFSKLDLFPALPLGAISIVKGHRFQTRPFRVVFHRTPGYLLAPLVHLFGPVVPAHFDGPLRWVWVRLWLARRSRGRARRHPTRLSAVLRGGTPLVVSLLRRAVSLHLWCRRISALRRSGGAASRVVWASVFWGLGSPERLVLGRGRMHPRGGLHCRRERRPRGRRGRRGVVMRWGRLRVPRHRWRSSQH